MDVREKLVELLGNIYLPTMDGIVSQTETTIPTLRNARKAERDGSNSLRKENDYGYQNRRLS